MSLTTVAQEGEVQKHRAGSIPLQPHAVQFYESKGFLAKSVSKFISDGLQNDEGVIVIATGEHIQSIELILGPQIDLAAAVIRNQLLILDAQETLELFMDGDIPNAGRFVNVIGKMIDEMAVSYPVIRAYGEMVNILWANENLKGTIALENLWSELAKDRKFSLLCGYSMHNFKNEIHGVAFSSVCGCHSLVHPSENYTGNAETDDHRRVIAELQQKTMALQTEISERRAVEHELRKSREELRVAKEIAEAANYTKSRFLANMSHEIRSPLTAILGFTELMKDSNISSAQRTGYADIVGRNGRQLSTLINDVLDLAKVDSGKLDIELIPISIASIVSDVANLFRQEALVKGIALKVDEIPRGFPERIYSDPTRIHQVLANLIGNAIKFTPSGEIKISFESSVNLVDGATIVGIRVEDSGIGISTGQQEGLFQPFIQADASTTRKYGGTGLGLALSKKLAQALGGDLILLRTRVGDGSMFLTTFAANLAALPKEKDFTQEDADQKFKFTEKLLNGIRILVAEDSPDNHLLMQQYLGAEGAIVEIAENGLEAVEKALKGDFHIILMDVMMPVCDGYDATRRLRSTGFKRPIVALTAHALREERERSFAEGCNEHLTKPINRRLLISTIAKFVFERT